MDFKLPSDTKALIFDLDGTLADTMPLHLKGWQEACRQFGIGMTPAFLRSLTGTPALKIAEKILKEYGNDDADAPEALFRKKIEYFYSVQDQVKEIKPVADIVRKYYGKLPMAVGTGGFREAVYNTLSAIDMTRYFDVIVTSGDVKNYKPHPETFLKCAWLMNIEPRYITVFEDGDFGLDAARAAGMNPVDVRSWYNNDWDLG